MRTIPQTESMQDLQIFVTKTFCVSSLNTRGTNFKLPTIEELSNNDKQLIQKIASDVCKESVIATYQKLLLIGQKIASVLQDCNIPTITEDSLAKSEVEVEMVSFQQEQEFWGTQRKMQNRSKLFVLHGPPGAGKSTLISKMPAIKNAEIFDTELLGNTLDDIKNAYTSLPPLKLDQIRICTSAHLFREFGVDAFRILILPPLDIYLTRLEKRNELFPEKRYQGEMRSYAKWNARKRHVDLCLENIDPASTIEEIYAFVSKYA
jgi:hypothetical protein